MRGLAGARWRGRPADLIQRLFVSLLSFLCNFLQLDRYVGEISHHNIFEIEQRQIEQLALIITLGVILSLLVLYNVNFAEVRPVYHSFEPDFLSEVCGFFWANNEISTIRN